MRNALRDALLEVKKKDDGLYLIVGDIGFGVFEGFQEKYTEDYLNIGICEANMIGVSAGMAMNGFTPLVYTIVPFLTMRCFEQIRVDIAMHNQKVILVGVGGGLAYGNLGPTHHSFEDIVLMSMLPNFKVFSPSQPNEGKACLDLALAYDGPSYIRLGKNGEPDLSQYLLSEQEGTKVYCHNEADCDLLIFTHGAITYECIKAANILKESGIKVSVCSALQVKPIPHSMLRICANQKHIVAVEEHSTYHSVGSSLLQAISVDGYSGKFKIFGIEDKFTEVVGSRDFLLKHHGIDGESLVGRISQEFGGQ
jgi:transketolase